MFSITFFTKNAQLTQPIRGYKGVGIFFERKQTLAIASGFKGISIHMNTPAGGAVKIKHYR